MQEGIASESLLRYYLLKLWTATEEELFELFMLK